MVQEQKPGAGQDGQEPSGQGAPGNDKEKSQVDAAGGESGEGGQEPQTFDLEYVKKLRKEAADWRTKHQQAQKKVEEFESQGLSEAQKIQRELEAVRKERDEMAARARGAEVMSAASRAGAKYPDAVAALVPGDTSTEDLDTTFKELRKRYPDMFKAAGGNADGGAGNGAADRAVDTPFGRIAAGLEAHNRGR